MPWAGWPHSPQRGSGPYCCWAGASHPSLGPADAHAPCTCSRVQTWVRPGSDPLPSPDPFPASPPPGRREGQPARMWVTVLPGQAQGVGPAPQAPAPCLALETGVLPPDRPHPDPFIKRRDSTFRWTHLAAGAPWLRRPSSPVFVGTVASGPQSPARGLKVPRARVAVVVEFLLHVHHVPGRLLEGPVRPSAQLPQVAQLGQPGPRAICWAWSASGQGGAARRGGGVTRNDCGGRLA